MDSLSTFTVLLHFLDLFIRHPDKLTSVSEELRAGLFQGYDDDWDSDFDDQPDQDASRMPPPAAPAAGGGGMLSIPKNSTQSGSSGDVRLDIVKHAIQKLDKFTFA